PSGAQAEGWYPKLIIMVAENPSRHGLLEELKNEEHKENQGDPRVATPLHDHGRQGQRSHRDEEPKPAGEKIFRLNGLPKIIQQVPGIKMPISKEGVPEDRTSPSSAKVGKNSAPDKDGCSP